MFIRKSEKKGIITLGILTMALFVLPQTIHKSECPIFLIPYSRLSDTTQPVPLKHLVIELNSADSTTLIGVRGIGPYYAKKNSALPGTIGRFPLYTSAWGNQIPIPEYRFITSLLLRESRSNPKKRTGHHEL